LGVIETITDSELVRDIDTAEIDLNIHLPRFRLVEEGAVLQGARIAVAQRAVNPAGKWCYRQNATSQQGIGLICRDGGECLLAWGYPIVAFE
jgi:hypothetical protein